MADILWLPDILADAFRGMRGYQVEAYPGFAERGRRSSFNPTHADHGGVCNHHTGAGAFDALLRYMAETSSIAPLCHWSTSRPHNGIVRVVIVSANRANHAGRGGRGRDGTPWVPTDQGNTYLVGGEHQNSGYQDWPDQQNEAIHIGSAAILRQLGHGADRAVDHKDYAPGRKWDRHSVSLAAEQAVIARYLRINPSFLEDLPMDDNTLFGLVVLTYRACLGRNPETLQIIAAGANAIRHNGLGAYVSSVANSAEGKAHERRLAKIV